VTDSNAMKMLPLFPLPNVVLFPGMTLALHIFEPRYRLLLRDVMATDACFGVVLSQNFNPQTMNGEPFTIGTIAEVQEYEILADGRSNIVVKGTTRFKICTVEDGADSTQYSVGHVLELQDEGEPEEIDDELIHQTQHLFTEALRLTHKIMKQPYHPLALSPKAAVLSWQVAEYLRGSLVLKQNLLEMTCVKERLEIELSTLEKVVKSLAVRSQIEEAFSSPLGE
jgi:ATP-dependent Lon protease